MVTVGGVLTGTTALPFAVHEPMLTMTSSVTLPDGPAVNEIALLPLPLSMVPLVIDELEAAPGCPATLALLAGDDAQGFAGAVMTAVGFPLTVTRCESFALQLFASKTVTL